MGYPNQYGYYGGYGYGQTGVPGQPGQATAQAAVADQHGGWDQAAAAAYYQGWGGFYTQQQDGTANGNGAQPQAQGQAGH